MIFPNGPRKHLEAARKCLAMWIDVKWSGLKCFKSEWWSESANKAGRLKDAYRRFAFFRNVGHNICIYSHCYFWSIVTAVMPIITATVDLVDWASKCHCTGQVILYTDSGRCLDLIYIYVFFFSIFHSNLFL